MARPRTKEWRLRRLYKQLRNFVDTPLFRERRKLVRNDGTLYPDEPVKTRRWRIEHAIQSIENASKEK